MSNAAAITRSLVAAALLAAALLAAPLASFAAEPAPTAGPERIRYLQSWFGAGDTDQPWELEAEEGPYTRDVGTIPYIGGSALYLHGNGFRYGWEAGGLLGWSSYDGAFRSDSSGLQVAIDASLFTFEVFFGGMLAYEPRPGLRFYVAGGPTLALMTLDNEDEEVEALPTSGIVIVVEEEEDDASVVPYARAGFEFQAGNGLSFGISARYAPHDFDFGTSGEVEFDGVQWFLIVGARR